MAWAAIDPDPQGPWLAVGCERSRYHLCEQVPGMNFRKTDGIWRAPLSWPAWVALTTTWVGQPLDVHPRLQEWAGQQWESVQLAYQWRAALDVPGHELISRDLDSLDARAGRELFPFQRGGAAWLYAWRRVLLGDPQGNGKTPQAIRAMQLAFRDSAGPWLVIAPAAALYNWERELHAWAPELNVRVIDGSAPKRRKIIMDELPADVYVIGWKTVRLHTRLARYPGKEFVRCDEHGGSTGKTVAQCEVHEKELNAITWAGIIADEAHRMKDAGSKQTRAVQYLAHRAEFFWPMTGTPVGDTIADLWPILHGIDQKAFPAKSRYLDLYAVKLLAWNQGTEYLGIKPETCLAYHATVQHYIRRIPKEIARAQLPGRYHGVLPPVFRYPQMTAAQDRYYRQLAKEARAELESTDIVPDNTVVKFSRLCQVAAATIETYDGEDGHGFTKQMVRMVAPSHKADDLLDFLADNPGQLVVCMNSPQLMKICETKLAAEKITHCVIRGGQSAAEHDQAVRWFQGGECRVIMITAGTGGEAITLTASDTVLFLQPNPSYLVTQQVTGRVDRIGQQNPVRVVYSITPGTVEERLYELSQDKTGRADAVTRDADLMRWMIGGGDAPVPVLPAPH